MQNAKFCKKNLLNNHRGEKVLVSAAVHHAREQEQQAVVRQALRLHFEFCIASNAVHHVPKRE